MGNWAYQSLDMMKANVAGTVTTDDAIRRRVLEAVSEAIDNYVGRTFRTYLATRVLSAEFGGHIRVPDLLAITTLKSDEDQDWDYDNLWATTDYILQPSNASVGRQPYTVLRTRPGGDHSFTGQPDGVQIVGKWGYFEELETLASLANEAMDSSETGFDVDAGTDFDVLDTLLVDSEQMYVTAIATNTLTVVRGVNGTTAAAHDTDSVIKRYRYPGPVVEACGIQAARVFKRKDAPFGVVGTVDSGFYSVRTLDPDVTQLLSPYRHLVVA